MAVTYTDTLLTDRDKVRFHLGDVTENAGPRPSDGNFSDAEIAGLITAEGSWQRAVAAGLERLAVEWTRNPTFKADGLTLNRSDIAKGYREAAEIWRTQFGRTIPAYVAGQINVDNYSDDITNDDVNTSSDYEGDWYYVVPK